MLDTTRGRRATSSHCRGELLNKGRCSITIDRMQAHKNSTQVASAIQTVHLRSQHGTILVTGFDSLDGSHAPSSTAHTRLLRLVTRRRLEDLRVDSRAQLRRDVHPQQAQCTIVHSTRFTK